MRTAVADRRSSATWQELDRGIVLLAAVIVLADLVWPIVGVPRLRPIDPLPVLVALAAACVASLARRAAPSLAWLALVAGALAASSVPIGQARIADPSSLGIDRWLSYAVPAGMAAIATLWLALRYATRPDGRLDPIALPVAGFLFGSLVVAIVTTLGAVVAGVPFDPAFTWIDLASAPIGWFVPFVVIVAALGAGADVRAALRRARLALGPATGDLREPARAWALAFATARELVPGQSAAAEASVAEERSRLAGDLHAVVLPSLRRAIVEAESGGDPDALARHLRTVDLELERLMADRWPVVLEAFGLVAAIEDLAERVEADGGPAVEIDVGQAGARPPKAVERAAWRVTQLAVDNVIRHADAHKISVAVTVDPARLHLAIADDGRGFDPADPTAIRPGARGLADTTRRAAAVGATVRIDASDGGGTTVAFDWTERPR